MKKQLEKGQSHYTHLVIVNEAGVLVNNKDEYLAIYLLMKLNSYKKERFYEGTFRELSTDEINEDFNKLPLVLYTGYLKGDIVERKPFTERHLDKSLLIINAVYLFKEWSDNENLNKEFWEEGLNQKRLDGKIERKSLGSGSDFEVVE